ncbi:MAG TPA: LysR family transcriptional regulator [Chloroflexota bacterium]|nr:LysR family transcriptional regulator [Chloroflexota bacterium]
MDEAPITLYKLRVLCEVVERQSFTLAAEHLFTTQPALSVHMRSLEQFFGTRLLYREGRRSLPTEAGEAVYRYARSVLHETEQVRALISELRDAQTGRIAIGATPTVGSYVLPQLISRFKQRNSRADLVLRVAPAPTLRDETLAGQHDFALVEAGPLPEGLAAEPLRREELVMVAHPDHPLASHAAVSWAEVRGQPFVLGPPGAAARAQLERQMADEARGWQVVLELEQAEAIKRAVQAGMGLAVLFRCEVAQELGLGLLREVRVPTAGLAHEFVLVYRPHKYFSPMTARFLDFLRTAAGNLPAPAPSLAH